MTREEREEILNSDKKFRYMMLDRLRTDCNYYLDGHQLKKHLWANDETEHVSLMIELYNSFDEEERPEWISMDDIKEYQRKMTGNIECYKAIPCCGCVDFERCSKTKISEEEITRYLKHHPNVTRNVADAGEIEWWINQYPVISYIPKRDASDFMKNCNHLLCRAGMDLLSLIQDYNYYKKYWGEKETCRLFIIAATKQVEKYNINVGISQNDNEAIIVLKDYM